MFTLVTFVKQSINFSKLKRVLHTSFEGSEKCCLPRSIAIKVNNRAAIAPGI